MNDEVIDIKEKKTNGLLQKLSDKFNKLPNNGDLRKAITLAIEESVKIPQAVREKENTKDKPKAEEKPKINSYELAIEIQKDMKNLKNTKEE